MASFFAFNPEHISVSFFLVFFPLLFSSLRPSVLSFLTVFRIGSARIRLIRYLSNITVFIGFITMARP